MNKRTLTEITSLVRIYYTVGGETELGVPRARAVPFYERSLIHKFPIIRGSPIIFSSQSTLEEAL